MQVSRIDLKKNYIPVLEILIIAGLACVPLFASFPYRVNIFLSWEGAYRMSEGQLPFRDFGIPLGGMYWVIPSLFFKLFGPQMISLIKAQVFINIISGLAFRSILSSCHVQPGIRLVSVLLYCCSFSFFNFWPWYNHSVIVYEFIGIAFLLKAVNAGKTGKTILWLALAALFTCCSFLTKQDAGGMAFLLCLFLLACSCIYSRKWWHLLVYSGAFVAILCLFILPFLKYDFAYWFNHGQAPHSARVSLLEILDEFFSASQWIKFYIFLIGLILFLRFRTFRQIGEDRSYLVFLLLTIAILGQAAVFQVTSYTPPDNNIFFHSFAIAFILTSLAKLVPISFSSRKSIIIGAAGVLLWWSGVYWKYLQRVIERGIPADTATVSPTGENIVNRKTYMIHAPDTSDIAEFKWIYSGLRSFDKIYMPSQTVEGMRRLLAMDGIRNRKDLKVLNMTELTPLAVEMPYTLEKGSYYPLWNHLGVGMFNKQASLFEKKIANKEYDLVLFEYLPALNNFYPFRVRDSLLVNYNKVDSFPAPRRGDTEGMIEVFRREKF